MTKFGLLLRACLMMYSLIFMINNTSAQEATSSSDSPKDEKNWSASVSATQYMSFTDQNDPSTGIDLEAETSLTENSTISLSQTLIKLYVVDPGEEELIVEDTKIAHSYKFDDKFLTTKVSFTTSATIPISEKSERNDHITTLKGRLSFSKKLLDKAFSISYKPFFSYYVKDYKQSVSGTPLNKYKFGHQIGLSYAPKESSWSLSGTLGASQTVKEQSKFQAGDSTTDFSYSFTIAASYSINNNMSLNAGYLHNNDQLTDGRVETTLFDEEISSTYAGLSFSF